VLSEEVGSVKEMDNGKNGREACRRRRSLLPSLMLTAIIILSLALSAVPLSLGIPGEGDASSMKSMLANVKKQEVKGKK
jgi:hypothetical protein